MESFERLIAQVTGWFQWLVGASEGRAGYDVTRWVFLRALGIIYLIAFLSLWVQIRGLIGSQGILPAAEYLDELKGYLGPERYRLVPTVFWWGASDAALQAVCLLGAACALLVIANLMPVPALALLWVLYLSVSSVGRDFLAFQWDVLLLETGFLAIFLAPGGLAPGRMAGAGGSGPSAIVLWLVWWLLFRLTFQSGLVKLTWGDPPWRDLTALDYHFYTQPLPTWTAWFAQQAPPLLKKLVVVVMYVLEIGAPLLIFGTREMRLVACAATVCLQLGIMVTGNYNFFNLLTIALALTLVDDASWTRVLPSRLVAGFTAGGGSGGTLMGAGRVALAALVLVVSAIKFWDNLSPRTSVSGAAAGFARWVDPFRSINSYGLFRVMTTVRHEIVLEGSNDGATWRAYEFKYKPGDPARRPGFVEPHQPRLDWQMWFAALERIETTPWFEPLAARLLEGSPAVLDLFATNPFPDAPPRLLRAALYDYRFTTPAERRASGAWWERRLLGAYAPVMSLQPVPR
ncbi:MAG TPA: lipase maturation factor family protein [Gemmatimonadales bacterium]|nr:lipase maturation factor family protein [Gemmatimonadales bacterium]